jgi:hypothetical protein
MPEKTFSSYIVTIHAQSSCMIHTAPPQSLLLCKVNSTLSYQMVESSSPLFISGLILPVVLAKGK